MIGNDADAATIAAIATAPGRGAIAIVRVSGPAADAVASALTGGHPLRPRVAERVRLRAPDGALIDRGLALRFPAPHSYTGDDLVEFHVHGSPAVARETLLAALAAGARLARPGEFTRRAFEAGKLDLCAAEAVGDLIAAEHRGQARGAAARLSGGLATAIDAERARLAETLEELSAALDFPDEVEAPTPAAFARRLGDVDAALADLATSWERGRLVREGCSIAIVGPPNVGKSSLLNALLGADRALVSPIAGTTRDTVEEQVALGDGIVGRLVDTAGLRDGADALEAAGIERARRALAEASVALVVVDGSRTLDPDARALVSATRDRARVVLYNKLDLGDDGYAAREAPERDALAGSVRRRSTVDGVRAALAAAAGSDGSDLARPHLGTARQADAVMTARRALAFALETATTGQPIDLAAGDVAAACAALGELTGRAASEAVLDRVFARFCIGK